MFVKFSDFKHSAAGQHACADDSGSVFYLGCLGFSFCVVAYKSLLYNKLAIFRVGETATLKIANQL